MSNGYFKYHCERYSIKDIKSFVEDLWYEVRNIENEDMLSIIWMGININFPILRNLKYVKKWKSYWTGSIFFKPINDLYCQRNRARESWNKELIEKAEKDYEQWHKEAYGLYKKLKKKIGILWIKTLHDVDRLIEKWEYPMAIKDIDYIKSLQKKWKKWWQFGF